MASKINWGRMENNTNKWMLVIVLLSALYGSVVLELIQVFDLEGTGVENGVSVDITATLGTSPASCIFDWDSGEIDNLLLQNADEQYSTNLNDSDYRTVVTVCVDDENIFINETTQYIGVAITSFQITDTADVLVSVDYPMVAPLDLTAKFATGSHVALNITILSTGYSLQFADVVSPFAVQLPESGFPSDPRGIYAVQVHVSNPHTDLDLTIGIVILKPVNVIGVFLPPETVATVTTEYYVAVDVPFYIVTEYTGDDIIFTWKVVNDDTGSTLRYEGAFCDNGGGNYTLNITLDTQASYRLLMEASNFGGYYSHEVIKIHTKYIMNEFSVTAADVDHLRSGGITFTMSTSGTAQGSMGNVACYFDFDDSSTPYTEVLTEVGASLSKNYFYTYSTIGHYIVNVTCVSSPSLINDIPLTTFPFSFYVKALHVVTDNLKLEHDSSNITRHAYSQPMTLTVVSFAPSSDRLPNITCIFNVIGVENVTVQLEGEVDPSGLNISTAITFPVGDVNYVISVTCSNEISTERLPDLDTHVYYDCWYGPFFDDVTRNPATPRLAEVDKYCEIGALIRLRPVPSCAPQNVLVWTIYDDTGHDVTNLVNPAGQQSLIIPAYTMRNVTYKIQLQSSFSAIGAVLVDFIYVKFTLPPLIAKITDGSTVTPLRQIRRADPYTIDSTESFDPAEDPNGIQPFLAAWPLTKSWTCRVSAAYVDEAAMQLYLATEELPAGFTNCDRALLPGGPNGDTYEIPENLFVAELFYLYELTYERAGRITQAVQVIQAFDKLPLPLSLVFIKNAHPSNGISKKLRYDDIELNLKLLDVDNSSMVVMWKFQKLDTVSNSFVDLFTQQDTTGFKISKALVNPGEKYLVACTVSLSDMPDYRETTVFQSYIGNFPPYKGTCTIDKTNVTAAFDSVCVSCNDYVDEQMNEERDEAIDTPGILQFAIYMFNVIGSGPTIDTTVSGILLSSEVSTKQCFVLHLPSNNNSYALVQVQIKDELLSPYAVESFTIQVWPAVSADISGADGVAAIEMQFGNITDTLEESLAIGDASTCTQMVSALASVLQMGGIENTYAMPKEPDIEGGGLGDIKDDGTVLTADDALKDLEKKDEDPTALKIREVKIALASYLSKALANFTEEQKTDPMVQLSVLKAAISLSSGSENGIDNTALQLLSGVVATSMELLPGIVRVHGNSESTTEFFNGMVEVMSFMAEAISPDSEKFLLPVFDMKDARGRLEQAFIFASPEEKSRIEKADMSEDERYFVTLRMNVQRGAKSDSRLTLGYELYDIMRNTLAMMLQYIPLSDGAQAQFGPKTSNPGATITMVRLTPDKVTTPLLGRKTTVQLPGINRQQGKISLGMCETHAVNARDEKLRFAHITSGETHLDIKMDKAIQLTGPIKFKFKISLPNFEVGAFEYNLEDADKMYRRKIFVNSPDDMVCIVNKPLDDRVESFDVYIACNGGDVTKLNFDASEVLGTYNDWTNCFEPARLSLKATGICRYGLQLNMKANDADNPSRKKRSTSNTTAPIMMNMTAATMACMVYTEDSEWASDRCSATWLPDEGELLCDCLPDRQMTFANSFHVPPNSIDFSSVFLKFSPLNQAAVMGTLAAIFVVYVLVVVWARRKDRKDLLKWGITPLADNFPEDNYFYVMKVFTGMRPGSGTKSKVGFVVAGEDMDSGVRELSDGVRKELRTGSVMNFLMSTTIYMGDLEYIRLWHDNSGQGNSASWYLSKIIVQDVQRNETFTFMVERWLAVEEEDGMLECVVPVSKTENLNVFKNRFFMNAKDNLAESHIWVSVMYRPQTSHFSRVQRATCALVFLMLTMISNAMFFQGDENYETPAAVKVGPFRFTLQQIYISLICALITTPATMIIIYLFKLSRPKPIVDKDLFPERARKYKIPIMESWLEKQQRKSMELEENLIAKGYPSYEGCSLPPMCRTFAWVISVMCVLLCSFFIMLYSMEWGKQKSEEWLSTFFLTFFESVFCLDPIKVAFMAVIVAILFRSAQDTKSVIDRNTIMKNYKSGMRGKSGGVRLPAPPLDKTKLNLAKAKRTIELKMKTAVKDIIFNIFIIWILFSLSFSTRDSWSYNMHEETVNTLLSPPNKVSFYDIKTINEYFDWLNNTAIVNMFPENNLQGERLHWRHRQFIEDGAKFRVGPPRLRQVRTTEQSCKIPYLGEEHCYKKYYEVNEERSSYCIGWNATKPCNPDERSYMFSSDAWEFTNSIDIWGFPISGYYTTYGGGGYIAKLSVNRDISLSILQELYENSWVDRQTRAVIFEFTLYSLNTNIFTYNVFMAEFPETGGVFSYVMILPLRVYMHLGAIGMYTIACEIIFIIYLVTITIMAIIGIVHQKKEYFKKPWQVFDLVFIVLSYIGILMYFVRLIFSNQSLNVFKEDKKAFVNFFHIALWDQVFVLLIGVLVFMAVLRLLNTFGYNKRIGAVAQVFTNAASELIWFGIFFLNIFMCYAVFGNLLFGSKLKSYKNIYKTMGTLFISMIGKSRFTEIEETDPIMSKLYFMIFVFFVVYMILTMFLAVLSKSIDQVHENVKKTKSDEMVDYAIKKLKNFFTFQRRRTGGNQAAANVRMTAAPPAPWSESRARGGEDFDNRAILEDIRMSLNQAILLDPSMKEKAKGAPKPDLRV